MATTTLERPVRNLKETAHYFGLSESLVRRMISEGRLRSVRVGRRHLISEKAIQAALDGDNDGRIVSR